MTHLKSILLLTVVCILFPTSWLYADMYSWTDENGVKHYSNTPPPKNLTVENYDSEEEILTTHTPSSKTIKTEHGGHSLKDDANEDAEEEASPKKRSASNQKVVMFTTPNCGWCKRAKAFFQKHNVQYIAYDIKKSKKAYKKFKELNGRGVPLILIGDKKIAGFNKNAISEALGLN